MGAARALEARGRAGAASRSVPAPAQTTHARAAAAGRPSWPGARRPPDGSIACTRARTSASPTHPRSAANAGRARIAPPPGSNISASARSDSHGRSRARRRRRGREPRSRGSRSEAAVASGVVPQAQRAAALEQDRCRCAPPSAARPHATRRRARSAPGRRAGGGSRAPRPRTARGRAGPRPGRRCTRRGAAARRRWPDRRSRRRRRATSTPRMAEVWRAAVR